MKEHALSLNENLVAYVKNSFHEHGSPPHHLTNPSNPNPSPPHTKPIPSPQWRLEEHLPISNENRTSHEKAESGKRKEERGKRKYPDSF